MCCVFHDLRRRGWGVKMKVVVTSGNSNIEDLCRRIANDETLGSIVERQVMVNRLLPKPSNEEYAAADESAE